MKQLGDTQPRGEGGMEVAVGREGVVAVVPPSPPPTFTPSRCPTMTEAPAIGRSRTLGTDVSCRFSPRPERARRQLQGSGSLRITTPPKNTPSTPKPLHNPPSTPGHAGQRPPQYDHCCAPGWLSPPYQRDETTSSTHAHTYTHTPSSGHECGGVLTRG